MTSGPPQWHGRSSAHGGLGGRRFHGLLEAMFYGGRRGRVFDRLVVASRARPGDRVLDVGCGRGYFSRRLAGRVGHDGVVVGVDADPEVVADAQHRGKSANCTFNVGDAVSLDIADGAYDVVVSSLMLHHLSEGDGRRAIAEMFRVLRPGGSVLIAEFRAPRAGLLRRLVARHSPAMAHNPVDLVESKVREAGFAQCEAGDLHPWIHYVRAMKPATEHSGHDDASDARRGRAAAATANPTCAP